MYSPEMILIVFAIEYAPNWLLKIVGAFFTLSEPAAWAVDAAILFIVGPFVRALSPRGVRP